MAKTRGPDQAQMWTCEHCGKKTVHETESAYPPSVCSEVKEGYRRERRCSVCFMGCKELVEMDLDELKQLKASKKDLNDQLASALVKSQHLSANVQQLQATVERLTAFVRGIELLQAELQKTLSEPPPMAT